MSAYLTTGISSQAIQADLKAAEARAVVEKGRKESCVHRGDTTPVRATPQALGFEQFGDYPANSYAELSEQLESPVRTPTPRLACEDGAIIFDWDDTLLPTSFCSKLTNGSGLTPDSQYYSEMARIALTVRDLLLAARRLGPVGIVTLGRPGWVRESAALYLPGLDVEELLDELEIPVFYARKHDLLANSRSWSEDMMILAKHDAMESCIDYLCGRAGQLAMSIGDSEIEYFAAKMLVAKLSAQREECLSSKTVLLATAPSLAQFNKQLHFLLGSIAFFHEHGGDLDVRPDAAGDLECTSSGRYLRI